MIPSAVVARLRKFEGNVPFMYRCTGGEVTIGVGHAIQTPDEACQLSWMAGGAPAAAQLIRSDYATIAHSAIGLPASSYESHTQCRMAPAVVDQLLLSDVTAFEKRLAAALPHWATYPEAAQEALFDMAFNLGLGGLLKFHNLLAAVDAGQWQTAAQQCHRVGIGEARNQETAALFRTCIPGSAA